MGGIVQDRVQRQTLRRNGEIQPGAAPSKLLFVGKNPRIAEFVNPQKGQADAGCFGLVEALAQGGSGPEVKRGKALDGFPVGDLVLGNDFSEEFYGLGAGRAFCQGDRSRANWWRPGELFSLLMEVGREKKEAVVPPPKAGFAFVDAAFAQDDALRSAAERSADQ